MLFEQSDSVAKLAEALAKAQGEMKAPAKDSVNPGFGSKYASLASVIDAVQGPLAKNGICRPQIPASIVEENGVRSIAVSTELRKGDEFIRCTLTSPLPQDSRTNPLQKLGFVISYLKRYSLGSMCGVAQEDSDGDMGEVEEVKQQPKATKPEKGCISKQQATALFRTITENHIDVNLFLESQSVTRLGELREENIDVIKSMINDPQPSICHRRHAELGRLIIDSKMDVADMTKFIKKFEVKHWSKIDEMRVDEAIKEVNDFIRDSNANGEAKPTQGTLEPKPVEHH